MRITLKILVQNIKVPTKLPLNFKVFKFAIALQRGDLFPPIPVFRNAHGTFELKGDGRHRLAAYKLLGKTHILANYAIPEEPYPYKNLVVKQ